MAVHSPSHARDREGIWHPPSLGHEHMIVCDFEGMFPPLLIFPPPSMVYPTMTGDGPSHDPSKVPSHNCYRRIYYGPTHVGVAGRLQRLRWEHEVPPGVFAAGVG